MRLASLRRFSEASEATMLEKQMVRERRVSQQCRTAPTRSPILLPARLRRAREHEGLASTKRASGRATASGEDRSNQ